MKCAAGATSVLLALALLASACDRPRDPSGMPDVLLVSLDTLRADRLSCYGNARRTTPNLDALAARGLRFAQALAPSGNTAPSHMSVFTGMHPFAHGVFNRDLASTTLLALDPSVPTLAQLANEAGWSTAAITEQGQLLEELGFGRGFDWNSVVHDSFQGRIAALDGYLGAQAADRPQFVFLHTYEPHGPYLPPRTYEFERFYGRYSDASYQGGFRRVTEELLDAPPGAKIATVQFDAVPQPSPADVRFLSDLYDENVAWTDHLFGKLMQTWSRHRDLERTIVVVFSDHGEAFYEHGALGHHSGLWREIVHVPLLVAGPGIAPRVVGETVSLTGLPAALLALLEVDVPATMEPALGDFRAGTAREQIAVHQLYLRSRGLAFHGAASRNLHHLYEIDVSGGAEWTTSRLFDWRVDPLEQRDLSASSSPAGARALAVALERARSASLATARRYPVVASGDGADAELLRQLELLGYR